MYEDNIKIVVMYILCRLVCSDAMARGIDFQNVEIVVNYDSPAHMRTYVHRVGRAGRAGKSGQAFTFVTPPEARFFKEMMKKANRFQLVTKYTFSRPSKEDKDLLEDCILKLSSTGA